MPTLLLEGPFESDYSLAIVNRRLAEALVRLSVPIRLHQRDNTTAYFPASAFLDAHQELAPLFLRDITATAADVHSRYIYPPYTDQFHGRLRVVHTYGWEESEFPQQYVRDFNSGLDLITTMSEFVREVLRRNGVRTPIEVTGLGADHILSIPAKPVAWFPTGAFNFLHISSCFPRKAADVLVDAFCREFTKRDDVRLIIKTFPNPHNEIERIVTDITRSYPNHAPIHVANDSLELGELRYLYEQAGCLVSASRGEGFGLPVAEAMFAGCPVIATMYSGQADICLEEHCWPVEYSIEPARTHLTEGRSVWANPLVDSLRSQMRDLYNADTRARQEKTRLARRFVGDRFTWKRVAELHWRHCEAMLATESRAGASNGEMRNDTLKIGFVTTWNTRCGIAEYTRHLATNLPNGHRIAIFANRPWEELVRADEDYVYRCWEPFTGARTTEGQIDELVAAILESGVQAVSIQYNFSFFTAAALHELLKKLREKRIVSTVTMHAIKHPDLPLFKQALETADFCICHRQTDVQSLQEFGLNNILLRRQGIVAARLDAAKNSPEFVPKRSHFIISCFGFFLPPKGISELILAFALAKSVRPFLRLKLMNALYPIPDSLTYAKHCIELIVEKGLAGDIEVCTSFLPNDQVLRELVESDLVVLPYTYSTESSSAAGASAIASLTPVLCSDLPLFDELSAVTHRFPRGNVLALANKLLQLLEDSKELTRYRDAQSSLVRKLAWPAVAKDFTEFVGAKVAQYRSTNPSNAQIGQRGYRAYSIGGQA